VSTVAIEITEPGGSPVDRTNSCIFQRCSFTQNMNAVAGNFEIWLRDPDRSLSFVTGSEISLSIDGILMFGGFVTQISQTDMFDANDTSTLPDYTTRAWILRGADYNIIFDRRVWRNTADYLHFIDLSAFTTDGSILRQLVDNYADLSGFSSSGIEDVATISGGDVIQQGDKLRKEFENLSFFGGTVWYIDPSKTFIYKPYDNVEKRWGLSDNPNRLPITASPASYQGATIGYRAVQMTEDASYMVNDALIWGGSKFAGSGGTVFARVQDSTSINDHSRWQVGETHFGERGYRLQEGVDARADVIINGPPGTDIIGQQKGLKNPQFQCNFTWFSEDVPLLSGTPDHIIPGDIVTIVMDTFDTTKLLPLRTLRTSFPNAFVADGTNLVQFDGTFGLQLSDPFTLWRYLLTNQGRVQQTVVTPVTSTSTTTVFGAAFSDEPTPATDGSTTVFSIPFGYIAGTVALYKNGLIQRRDVDYTESNPATGEITCTTAPLATDNLWLICSTLDS
jgi:hypothetical protein